MKNAKMETQLMMMDALIAKEIQDTYVQLLVLYAKLFVKTLLLLG